MEQTYVCIIKMGNKYGLMVAKEGDNWLIHGFEGELEGIEYFDQGYKDCHSRGYESSMSACINAITYRPSIVKLTISEIELLVEKHVIIKAWHSSGGMHYVPLIADKADIIWDNGTKPELIRDYSKSLSLSL